jgi:phospholipid/cholesterol/gamma-HCH transport system substrate-binding protein
MIEANRKVAFAVGLFVTLVVALGAAVVLFIGVRAPVISQRTALRAQVDDAVGLRVGSRVLIAGVAVGEVARINLAPAEAGGGAMLDLHVSRTAMRRLRRDASTSLRSIGLLGDRVVALDPGRADEPIEPGAVLPGHHAADPGEILERANTAVAHLDGLLVRLEKSPAIPDLEATSLALRRTAERAARGPGLVHELVFAPSLAGDARDTVADARRAAATVATATRRIDDSSAHITRAASDLRAVVGHVQSGQGTVGGLIYDPAVYDGLRTAVGGLQRSFILRTLVRHALKKGRR